MTSRPPKLDRVRGRASTAVVPAAPDGKRALFSPAESRPPLGAVTVSCSRCDRQSVLTVAQALRALLPSLHLPLPWRSHRTLLRCPACRRVSWVALKVRL